MATKLIFDVSTKPFPWPIFWNSVGAFIFGFLLAAVKKLTSRYGSTTIGYLLILAGVIYCLYSSASWYLQRREHLKALASGHFEIAQGVVQNFQPMPDDGSSSESFTISGHAFSYSDYDKLAIDSCFNQTTPHDGPIHAGISLRVSFTDSCILRIQETPNDSGKLEH